MVRRTMSLASFEKFLPSVCDRDTSAAPEGWTTDNPLWGHCAIVALVVQELYGGEILRASLNGTPFSSMRSHYWNRTPDGTEWDLSRTQFGPDRPPLEGQPLTGDGRPLTRAELLNNADTARRFTLLIRRIRLAQSLGQT